MPSIDQLLEARDLLGQGQTTRQVAEALGIDVGDVETIRGGGMFLPAEGAKGGGLQIVGFDFQHDTPGLAAGVTAYTPTPGDIIVICWVEVEIAWNGTTPKLAVQWADPLGPAGWNVFDFAGMDMTGGGATLPGVPASDYSPGRPTTTDPLKIAVTSDGTVGGPDPGATQGKGTLYWVMGKRSN